jgi:FkbM family methyltransferase
MMKEKPRVIISKISPAGDRFTRIKKYLVRTLTEKASFFLHGRARDQTYWSEIFMRQQEQKCPAQYFRKAAMTLRQNGDLVAAEEICGRGLAIHPKDLSLAKEHAEIARTARDLPARALRYQRAIDLAGKNATPAAWRDLAESHRLLGNFEKAESIILDGLKHHPDDFILMEKLTEVFATNGSSLKAIAALESIITTHPDAAQISCYLRLCKVLSEEGLVSRAIDILNEGIIKYPDSLDLTNKLAELHYLQEPPTKQLLTSSPFPAHSDYTTHLFRDDAAPFAQGTLCLSISNDISKKHVPAMLDFAHTIEPPAVSRRLPEVDIFAVWGEPNSQSAVLLKLAAIHGKPLLYLDHGLLNAPRGCIENQSTHSIIVSNYRIYDDAFCPLLLETTLNSENYALTPEQIIRAESCIALVISHRISYANDSDVSSAQLSLPSPKASRILLIDQTTDDASVHRGLGGEGSFMRMLATALALRDHEILIYLAPRVDSDQRRSQLKNLLPIPLPQNVTIIDCGMNPHDLFAVVGQVFVVTSPLGFEAVMAGSQVHCFAAPFYAGWGFTTDHTVVPIRRIQRTATEIFHYYYMILSRYYVPGHVDADIETFIQDCRKREICPATLKDTQNHAASKCNEPLRILIVIPSRRHGATGRYLQNLSVALIRLGCEIVILAEGSYQRVEDGVRWLALHFEGVRLTSILQQEIVKFAPHFVYENGVRSRAQRAAVEAVLLTGARFAMQSEDDDTQIYRHHCGDTSADLLCTLDKPQLTTSEIAKTFQELDWNHSLQVFLDPQFDRWVEPVLRGLCYRMACFHTAIWYPFAERLAREYAVPTLVVPPVARASDFERLPMTPPERAMVLQRYRIDPSATVIFIGGALYSYSNEFALFLDALQLAASEPNTNFALVVTSDRSALPLAEMAAERLSPSVSFTDIGFASDIGYMEMLKACDVVCSPGIPDDFNRYRLPSRLVKAMAMGKPILTCRCGFGESLENNHNAFLTEGNKPADWVEPITACLDPTKRAEVGQNGRIFAEQHFDSDRVAAALKMQFEAMMEGPAHQLSDRISLHSVVPTPGQTSRAANASKVLPSDRYRSTMQDAIQPLKQRGIELGTVVHIGAGKCGELEDYCRLGAKQIILIEPLPNLAASLRKYQDRFGKIVIHQMAVSETTGSHQAYICKNIRTDSADHEEFYLSKPTALLDQQPALQLLRTEAVETCTVQEICQNIQFNGSNDLLVLELNGLELAALRAIPELLIRNFEWIMVHVSEPQMYEGVGISLQVESFLEENGFKVFLGQQKATKKIISILFKK